MKNPLEAYFPPSKEEQEKNQQAAMMMFANRLITAMNIRKMSAAELARQTGIKPATISQYKQGKYHPKYDRQEAIATALNVSSNWLLGLSDQMETPIFNDIITLNYTKIPQLNTYENLSLEEPLNDYFISELSENIPQTSLKITNENMAKAGINTGDIVFIDTTATIENQQIQNGNIIAVNINEEIQLKRIFFTNTENNINTEIQLSSEDAKTPTLIFNITDKPNIIGKATTVQKKLY